MREIVADYPRPPRLERDLRRIRVRFAGVLVVDTPASWRVLETYHPPSFYIAMAAFARGCLVRTRRTSLCEWKGRASYFDVTAAGRVAHNAAWGYDEPSAAFAPIRNHVAVYPGAMECWVGDEIVTPQPGGFYGGWITSELVGPFKGEPGTLDW